MRIGYAIACESAKFQHNAPHAESWKCAKSGYSGCHAFYVIKIEQSTQHWGKNGEEKIISISGREEMMHLFGCASEYEYESVMAMMSLWWHSVHHREIGTSTLLTLAACLAMPEIQELYFFHQILHDFIQDCNNNSHSLQLRAFWFDCKSLEIRKKLVTDKKAVKGHVIPLTFDYAHLTRGSWSSKMVLYPPEDVVPALAQSSTPRAFRDAGLVLRDTILDPRFITLDLYMMILEVSLIISCSGCYIHASYVTQVQVLQHCSPQIYTIHDWNERICKVDQWVSRITFSWQERTHPFARNANSRLRLLWNSSTMSWCLVPRTTIQGWEELLWSSDSI